VRLVAGLAALALLAAACAGDDGGSDSNPTTDGATRVTITLVDESGRTAGLTVEVARTAEERARGLMGREELAEDAGVLFVYESDSAASFWMKDTLIPLSIAFIAADGTVLELRDMEPLSRELHRPGQPYRYALEVNRGWFERHGLGAGDRVEIPETAKNVGAD
jgi:uncharacterized membrane protein (UPF0127 family)